MKNRTPYSGVFEYYHFYYYYYYDCVRRVNLVGRQEFNLAASVLV
jgi:hypothetical protein